MGEFRKGDELVVSGRLKQRSYENRDGEKRTVFELLLDHVGPSVRWKQARIVDTGVAARTHPEPHAEDPFGDAPDATKAPF